MPLGVDRAFLGPSATPLPLQTSKRFKFLFVGGTLNAQGDRRAAEAYRQAFSDSDDVCLVVKDMGVGTFYQGQTAAGSDRR